MGLGTNMLRKGWGRRRMSQTVDSDYFPFEGGLVTELPPLSQPPGALLACKNFEPDQHGGYSRVDGYERFDGHAKISDQPFYSVRFTYTNATSFTDGETVTGGTSGATATVRAVYEDATAAVGVEGFLLFYSITSGPFSSGETLTGGTSGATATADAASTTNSAPTAALYETWKNKAEDNYRSTVLVVPGSGSVLGVWIYNDKVYAFRNNAGGTACVMHEATTSGWSAVSLGTIINFDTGTTEIAEGDTVTGATSGASCTARRVILQTGTWDAGDAQGYFVTDSITSGPFSTGENLQVSAATVAVADSTTAQESQTLPAGGTYRFHNHNFGGHTSTYRMYGVNGAGNAFEFDNEGAVDVFVLIRTGMDTDTPTHLEEFRNHLFLAFPGGSLQNSGLGQPLSWNPITGSDEQNIGDTVTNMHADRDRAMFITARDSTWVLYGETRETFRLDRYTEETGAIENSLLRMGKIYYIDDRGATDLESSEKFGNFVANSVSSMVSGRIVDRLRSSSVVASHISRRKQLLRWTFSDGVTVVMGVRGLEAVGFTEIQLGKTLKCACSGEMTSGSIKVERIFVGASDGYVYELDSGSFNFDGDPIEAFLRLSYHYSKSPDRVKKYHQLAFDADAEGNAEFDVTIDYNYGQETGIANKTLSIPAPGGFYDVSNWGEFVYGAAQFTRPAMTLYSEGYNIGMYIYTSSDTMQSFTIKGVSLQWSPRTINRDTEV